MELAESNRLKDIEEREARAREEALAEIERNKRAAATAQETAWQCPLLLPYWPFLGPNFFPHLDSLLCHICRHKPYRHGKGGIGL